MSQLTRALCTVFVWAALAALPIELRAEVVPVNPLRRTATNAPLGTSQLRLLAEAWQDEPLEPEIRLVQSAEELPPLQQPSVVPRNFGGHRAGESAGYYGEGPYATDPYANYPPEEAENWPGPHPARRVFHWPHTGTWLPIHWFGHSDPNDPYRHTGMGEPLIGTSWRNRPFYFGLFVGGIFNEALIRHEVLQNNAAFLGMRIGWDFDHYWGLEGRYAFARPEALTVSGIPLPDSARDYYGDVSLLYYPWGDSTWRPYISFGLGLANFRFINENGVYINDSAFGMPIGIGMKNYTSRWCTLRLDLVDNIAFGTNQVSSMHNFSIMAGVEFRFGGRSTSYFPWSGDTVYW